MNYRKLQALVLRSVAVVEMFAFGAVLLPRAWMEASYGWLGVGAMPEGPVFDSVMRQVSFTYGCHGIGLWLIGADVVRYKPLVILTAVGYLVAGPTFFIIDRALGLPWTWMAGSGGCCTLIGALLLGLLIAERNQAQPRRAAAAREEAPVPVRPQAGTAGDRPA